jgi:subtilase family protein
MHQLGRRIGEQGLGSRRLRAGVAGMSALATIVGVGGLSAAMAAPAGPLAPASDGAASGGAVIVVLKSQHPGLNERTQARALKTATASDQAALVAAIRADGGTNLLQLSEPSAVAATLSASAVASLRANPAVAQVIPDPQIQVAPANPLAAPPVAPKSAGTAAKPGACPFNPNPSKPLEEGEANAQIHASNGIPGAANEANSIATGVGVVVANEGMNQLAGNPNFTRSDGTHVVLDAPDYTADHSNDEFYGDASTIAAQGTVDYQYSGALPNATVPIPPNCTFYIEGDAPGASLLDLSNTPFSGNTQSLAQVISGVDAAVGNGADVISESFGANYVPGSASQAFVATDDAAVAAGVTVVASSGDSGDSGTMAAPSMDPNIISAAGVDSFRLIAMDDGYSKYVSNNISALSSGGTAPTNRITDLAAPSWYGTEAACADGVGGCPPNYPTESMRGTSESAPLISGAAADVIQAYRDTHGGASPTPAMVKDILTGTATDIHSPSDQQGSGLLNAYAAVKAAQEMPGSTLRGGNGSSAVVATPSQLDLQGDGGSVTDQSVSLYNTSNHPMTVTGQYRQIGPEFQVGRTVTENVSAPDPSLPVPEAGATAAPTINFTVPGHLDRLDVDMIWPDPSNANRLYYQLFNPQGALVQESYDDGRLPTATRAGSIPNTQHVEVSDPQAGRWTAKIFWGGVDQDLALPQPAPGSYTGTMSFRIGGQNWVTSPASQSVTIPSHTSRAVPLRVAFPAAPGDHPESVQFAAGEGDDSAVTSVPVARRTLIPAQGGSFQTLITSTVGRSLGQLDTYKMNVPSGLSQLTVTFHASDASSDNTITYFLVAPNGTVQRVSTPNTTGSDPGTQTLTATAPAAGLWEIDVELGLTVSGHEFTQTVDGAVTETTG